MLENKISVSSIQSECEAAEKRLPGPDAFLTFDFCHTVARLPKALFTHVA